MNEARWQQLIDRCIAVVGLRPQLMHYAPLPEVGEPVYEGRELAEARMGAIVVAALVALSEDLHPPGDRTVCPDDGLNQEHAVLLVKEAGSLRRAALQYGISKSALQRATKGVYR